MADVTLDNLTRSFRSRKGEVCAVNDLSLSVAHGEFVVLIGPSGCGKTTTLRLIAGLDDPTKGTIRIGGRVVNHIAPKDRDVAMVFQNHALYPHLSVFNNMAFALKMRRAPKAQITRKVGEVAEKLGLTSLLDRKPTALSGGEQQRVALGRAIVRKPQVFLFDEPLSNLDARLRVQMRAQLKELHRELQTTILYVTHDQEEAMTLGDRLAILRGGVLQQVGPPMEIYNRPANTFVAGLVGTPSMNFFEGQLECNGPSICFVGQLGCLPLPQTMSANLRTYGGQKVVLGIRPQHVRIHPPSAQASGFRCDGVVQRLEPLGDCVNIHMDTSGGEALVARVPATTIVSVNERLSIEMDLAHAQVFFSPDGANTHAAMLRVDRSRRGFLA